MLTYDSRLPSARKVQAGAPLRVVQEWLGYRDSKTTSIYADYAPDPSQGTGRTERAFGGIAYRTHGGENRERRSHS